VKGQKNKTIKHSFNKPLQKKGGKKRKEKKKRKKKEKKNSKTKNNVKKTQKKGCTKEIFSITKIKTKKRFHHKRENEKTKKILRLKKKNEMTRNERDSQFLLLSYQSSEHLFESVQISSNRK